MAVIWEEILTLSATATCDVPGSIVVATDEALFNNAYLGLSDLAYRHLDYSVHVPYGAFGTSGNASWGPTIIPGGLRLTVTAELYAGAESPRDFATISVTVTYYGIRLSDDEAFGLTTPILERRIT